MPDPSCDIDSNPSCIHHKGAIHCVRTGQPSYTGSEQQCCYDRNKYLMLSYDQMWGSRVRKVHDIGQMPWNEAGKVYFVAMVPRRESLLFVLHVAG